MRDEWWVEIRHIDGDKLERRLGPFATDRGAERCERGVNINMDAERFYTLIEKERS